jgi:hypothetical protein
MALHERPLASRLQMNDCAARRNPRGTAPRAGCARGCNARGADAGQVGGFSRRLVPSR